MKKLLQNIDNFVFRWRLKRNIRKSESLKKETDGMNFTEKYPLTKKGLAKFTEDSRSLAMYLVEFELDGVEFAYLSFSIEAVFDQPITVVIRFRSTNGDGLQIGTSVKGFRITGMTYTKDKKVKFLIKS